MDIICVGISHHTASVEKREAVSLPCSRLGQTFQEQADSRVLPEVVVLSTCNRTELYGAAVDAAAIDDLYTLWADALGVDAADLYEHSFSYSNEKAINHLLKVSSGLDSLVLGEPQILGQVTDAFEDSQQAKLCGPWMRTLFRTAIKTGKRVRTETRIGQNAASISSVAVKLAEQHLGNLDEANVLLIGAGKMGVLALKALQEHEIGTISVVNRTKRHAQDVADEFGGTAYGFEHLQGLMEGADLVISSTGAPYTLIDCDFMRPVSEARKTPLLMLDIAVPRDIDPLVRDLPNINLFDIDALQGVVDSALEQRRLEIPHVNAIIEEEKAAFFKKSHELHARPTITDLRAKAELIRKRELDRIFKSVDDDEARRKLELLSQSLVNKLLHAPTAKLRQVSGQGDAAEYTQTVRELFALDE